MQPLLALSEQLQNEANQKVNKAWNLFLAVDDGMKSTCLYGTGFKGVVNAEAVIKHFDYLDLIDQLDNCIENLQWDLDNPSS